MGRLGRESRINDRPCFSNDRTESNLSADFPFTNLFVDFVLRIGSTAKSTNEKTFKSLLSRHQLN